MKKNHFAKILLAISIIGAILLPLLNFHISTAAFRYVPRHEIYDVMEIYSNRFGFFLFYIFIFLMIPVSLTVGNNYSKKNKDTGRDFFLIALILFFTIIGLMYSSRKASEFKYRAFLEMTLRAEPLINAIEKYRADNGDFPYNIEELIPFYIPERPYTGIPIYPNYQYESASSSEGEIEEYELKVYCSHGMSFDSFFYWPKKEYPQRIYGGEVQRIGDWAYVHE